MDIFTWPHNRQYHPPAPMIELEFHRGGKQRQALRLLALVDSGADTTIIPFDILDRIGARPIGPASLRSFMGEIRIVEF